MHALSCPQPDGISTKGTMQVAGLGLRFEDDLMIPRG